MNLRKAGLLGNASSLLFEGLSLFICVCVVLRMKPLALNLTPPSCFNIFYVKDKLVVQMGLELAVLLPQLSKVLVL